MPALFNGAPVEDGLSSSRALHYGDGVFRTVLRAGGHFVDWPLHLAKLADDCARLRLQAPEGALLRSEAENLCAATPDAVLKIICSRRPGGRGYAPSGAASDRLMFRYPPPDEPPARWTEGVSVGFSQVTLGDQPALAGIKHLNRLEQVLASGDRPPQHAEMLMCDAQGHVVCGTRSNLFWVASGVLMTPSLERSGVAGVMRQKILDLARQQGIPARTVAQAAREIRPDEAFLCNAVIGIWPIAGFAGRALLAPGTVTQRLRAALAHPWPRT